MIGFENSDFLIVAIEVFSKTFCIVLEWKVIELCLIAGAVAPSWLALLPANVEGPKGGYVWHDKQIVDVVEGPLPSAY